MAMFLAALDQTIIATALPTIGREIGDFDLLPWVVTSYLLTATAVTPLYGKFSDIRGRRRTMLVGIGLFVAGSVACALAPTMIVLILARGLQGLGGGGLISLAQTIIGDIVAPKERGRYQAYIAGVFVSSSLAGPVLGGFFAEHLHWSIIFWINVPLGLIAFFMTDRLLRRLPRHDRPHALDVLGAVLLVAATSVLMLALNWGGVRYPWGSLQILSPIRRLACPLGGCSRSGSAVRRSRSSRSTCSPIRSCATARSRRCSAWARSSGSASTCLSTWSRSLGCRRAIPGWR